MRGWPTWALYGAQATSGPLANRSLTGPREVNEKSGEISLHLCRLCDARKALHCFAFILKVTVSNIPSLPESSGSLSHINSGSLMAEYLSEQERACETRYFCSIRRVFSPLCTGIFPLCAHFHTSHPCPRNDWSCTHFGLVPLKWGGAGAKRCVLMSSIEMTMHCWPALLNSGTLSNDVLTFKKWLVLLLFLFPL